MALDDYKFGFGAATRRSGTQAVRAGTPSVSIRRRANAQANVSYGIRYAQLQSEELKDTNGVIDLFDQNGAVATTDFTPPDGATQDTVRFSKSGPASTVRGYTFAVVEAEYIQVR